MVFDSFFKGKVVLVTGAGRGIGRALCVKLHSIGAVVWAVSKNPDNLSSLKSECEGIQTVAVDLSNWKETRKALEKIPDVMDCLVNNAGVISVQDFMETTEEELDRVGSINLKAVINVSQVIVRRMIERGSPGTVVNISSTGGLKAFPVITPYSLNKAALDQLTKIMAIELGPHKIRVNSVNPGPVSTDLLDTFMAKSEMTFDTVAFIDRCPLRRHISEMREVLNTILFYLSDLVPIVTGTIMAVDGGFVIT